MYDKYISDTQNAMDDMLGNLEDFFNDLAEDRNKLIRTGINIIKGSTKSISKTLGQLSKDYNAPLSDEIKNIWGKYKNAEKGINAIIAAIQALQKKTDKKNDQDAYQTAASAYFDYHSYDKSLKKAKKKRDKLKDKRKKAKKKVSSAKKKLDEAKKKYGKNSKQYQTAYKAWKTAKQQYNTIDKQYKKSKQEVSGIQAKQKDAKKSNATIIRDFLYAIADKEPSKPKKEMDALDQAILKLTGGYIDERNREQLFKLLKVKNAGHAVKFLKELGIIKKQDSKKPDKKKKPEPSKTNTTKPSNKIHDDRLDKELYTLEAGKAETAKPSSKIHDDRLDKELYTLVHPERANIGNRIFSDTLYDTIPFDQINKKINPEIERMQHILAAKPVAENFSVTIGDLYLPNVTEPKEFANDLVDALKNDAAVKKTFGTFINASLTHGNSLSIRKF